MTVFLLIITLWSSEAVSSGDRPTERLVVRSPQDAALKVWERAQGLAWHERLDAQLYRVDLEHLTVAQVPIPGLSFTWTWKDEKAPSP